MSIEENKALVRRLNEEMWKGNVDVVDEFVASDTLLGGTTPEQWKAQVLAFRELLPDLTFTIDEMIAEGDKVVYRWTIKSTHTSVLPTPFGPANPTGKMTTSTGITIYRVVGGKVVEDRYEGNDMAFYTQLGVIPEPKQNS